jgi:hypothetical protein
MAEPPPSCPCQVDRAAQTLVHGAPEEVAPLLLHQGIRQDNPSRMLSSYTKMQARALLLGALQVLEETAASNPVTRLLLQQTTCVCKPG